MAPRRAPVPAIVGSRLSERNHPVSRGASAFDDGLYVADHVLGPGRAARMGEVAGSIDAVNASSARAGTKRAARDRRRPPCVVDVAFHEAGPGSGRTPIDAAQLAR